MQIDKYDLMTGRARDRFNPLVAAAQSGDQSAKMELWGLMVPALLSKWERKMRVPYMTAGLDVEDYKQEMWILFDNCVELFDTTRGDASFSSYLLNAMWRGGYGPAAAAYAACHGLKKRHVTHSKGKWPKHRAEWQRLESTGEPIDFEDVQAMDAEAQVCGASAARKVVDHMLKHTRGPIDEDIVKAWTIEDQDDHIAQISSKYGLSRQAISKRQRRLREIAERHLATMGAKA